MDRTILEHFKEAHRTNWTRRIPRKDQQCWACGEAIPKHVNKGPMIQYIAGSVAPGSVQSHYLCHSCEAQTMLVPPPGNMPAAAPAGRERRDFHASPCNTGDYLEE